MYRPTTEPSFQLNKYDTGGTQILGFYNMLIQYEDTIDKKKKKEI